MDALARLAGTSASQINKLEKGERRLSQGWMVRIGAALGVPPGQLFGAVEPAGAAGPAGADALHPRRVRAGSVELVAIPRFDAAIAQGKGCIFDQDAGPAGVWYAETGWLRSVTSADPSCLAVLRVAGDSMADSLNDGDLVLVDLEQALVANDGIFVLRVASSVLVRRLSWDVAVKRVRAIADNRRYPAQDVREEDLVVIGRVAGIVAKKV